MVGIIRLAALLTILPILGTLAFMWVEGWSFFDSLYMAIITLTTVGYQEVHPLSTGGRAVVMVYLFFGLGIFFYGIVQLGEQVVRTELTSIIDRRKKVDNVIEKIFDHHVICGFGRMGQNIARTLKSRGEKFVIIDKNHNHVNDARLDGWLAVQGDVTDDRTLQKANIGKAKGLAAVLPNDADNLYVVLSSRLLNKDLRILSRAADEKNEEKMKRAGADHVVSPYKSGAKKMAHLLMNSHLQNFMEVIDDRDNDVDLAQVHVEEDLARISHRIF